MLHHQARVHDGGLLVEGPPKGKEHILAAPSLGEASAFPLLKFVVDIHTSSSHYDDVTGLDHEWLAKGSSVTPVACS